MAKKKLPVFISKTFAKIVLISTIFGFVGVGVYYAFPPTYKATGTFFVRRSIEEPVDGFFSYEGYYAQQVALSYTKTFATLLESPDIQSNALSRLKTPVSEETLRRISKKVRVKSAGPQLVTLIVKGKSVGEATNTWAALSDVAIDAANQLNVFGDRLISIEPVLDEPVAHIAFRNVYLNFVLGVLFGVAFCLSLFSLSKIFEEK